MIDESQQEQASLYAAGALPPEERQAFEAVLRGSAELRELLRDLERAAGSLAMSTPAVPLPPSLKDKVLRRIESADKLNVPANAAEILPGHRFLPDAAQTNWKQLPLPGAWIKLLSLERERGYAVLLGKLDAGVRYPAHTNIGPEDFFILTGDLHIGERKLTAGDFHHADAGSFHAENYSVEGCTLLAVLTLDDPLVAFAMAP
ncbi:MAG TPA: cupin domain-containing protein [Verrucomicrobiae bacterium]|jgi:anti-sigma factor ChrR (cupin superfamily)|nr:cupin domain-containing protein [Verrucomicrobiae bacterium]